MKRLLVVVCLLLSTLASASDYLTVTGTGKTFEEAKQQAFRNAIEFKVGATVLSDVETQNYQRIKDEIYVYSAGYVDDYKVLSQETTQSNITVLLSVSVADSKLKNRIIGAGKDSSTFNGDLHVAQVSTFLQEKEQADRLFKKVLDGYPSKAYTVKQPKPYAITMLDRKPVISVWYELSWNVDYLLSLRETLGTVEDCKNTWSRGCDYKIYTIAKDPKDMFASETKHFFGDRARNDQLHNRFAFNTPQIITTLYDKYNTKLVNFCYTPKFISGYGDSFYNTGNEFKSVIYGRSVESSWMWIHGLSLSEINDIAKIEVSVGTKENCKK